MDSKVMSKTVRLAMKGDKDAFDELYRAYAKTILFHVRNHVWDSEAAEDVAQEVVIQMLGSIQNLKSPYAFSSWLQRLIIFTCGKHNERFGRRRGQESVLEQAEEIVDQNEANIPEELATSNDQRAVLYRQICRLPESQRTVLLMHYYEELSYKTIARVLEIEIGTVASNISKAKKNLKAIMDEDRHIEQKAEGGQYGLASSSAIAGAFAFAADTIAPPSIVSSFCDKVSVDVDKFFAQPQPAAAVAKQGLNASLVALILMGIGIVAVAGVLIISLLSGAPQNQTEKHQNFTYQADAEILLQSDGAENGNINPYQASIVIYDGLGTAVGWSIEDSAGTEVAAGTGTPAGETLTNLAPGEYRILWQIEDERGIISVVKRVFYRE
jgi:RNA polymerase sigma-70 factor (ECF subfamily)